MKISSTLDCFRTSAATSFIWDPNTTLVDQGCNQTGKFAFVVHGWQASKKTFIVKLVNKLLKYRGGCVISLNWGSFSDNNDYVRTRIVYVPGVSGALLRRLKQLETEGVSGDDIFMYGHSMGARIVVDAGIKFGTQKIAQIDGSMTMRNLK